MSEELQRRLRANEQRRRAEEGLQLRANFLARFEIATGVRVEDGDAFLPLDESDVLVERAYARVRETPRDAEWRDLTSLALDALAALADRAGHARYYLHASTIDLTGVAKVPIAPLLRHVETFWMPQQEDLLLVSRDLEDGLLFEWCDHWIELRTWGWLHTLID